MSAAMSTQGTYASYPDQAVPIRNEVRLRVKRRTATRGGHVAGAWWPRSHDPATEFPELVLVTSSWVGPVRRVDYHCDDWDPTGPELIVEGWLVSVVGSATLEAHTVVVTGTDQQRMSLLIIPPSTPSRVARVMLRSAG
jgi:hypothetical protein